MEDRLCVTQEVVRYLITFMLGEENVNLLRHIWYMKPEQKAEKGIYIIPSAFFKKDVFLTKYSMPGTAVEGPDGVKILFGSDKVEYHKDYVILRADLIASAFFMVTRYEEYIRRECRDMHGRMIGRVSYLCQNGLLQEPVVESYGVLLRKLLGQIGIKAAEPVPGIRKIYMTHDIDRPWSIKRNAAALAESIIRDTAGILLNRNRTFHLKHLKCLSGRIKDPVDTFDWFIKMDSTIKQTAGADFESIYFLMTCKKSKYDFGYFTECKRTRKLIQKLESSGAAIGIHLSYKAGENPVKIKKECQKFRRFMKKAPRLSRNHFLMSREPEDMENLIENGITDDFSCCFADGGGFRLGTCRPIKWINPLTMTVTNLTLHPLFVTEGKLFLKEYMGFTYQEALNYICGQIDKIKMYAGEAVILFHNTSVSLESDYDYRSLYEAVIHYLRKAG